MDVFTRHNAITPGVLRGDFLHRQHRLLQRFKLRSHLGQYGLCARRPDHQVVCQQHRKWLIADQVLGA